MGNHLEGFRDEGPPHGDLDVLIDFLDPSTGFVLGYQLDAWQKSLQKDARWDFVFRPTRQYVQERSLTICENRRSCIFHP